MVVLHAFLALLTGFAVQFAAGAGFTALAARIWAGDSTPAGPWRTFTDLGCTFLAAAAGGYVTAWIGYTAPLAYTLVLAIVVLMLAGLNAIFARSQHRLAEQIALVALTPIGVVAGGLIRLRVLRVI